jgi:hypothetical protein
VPYTTAEGREQLLDTVADAVELLGTALADLTELYELLDERTADVLEEEVFRPVQRAYGRARRAYSDFAARHELPNREFQPAVAGAPSHGVRGFLDSATDSVGQADVVLAELQDSLLPVEVGDAQLRADLEAVRTLLSGVRASAREITRTLGR